MGMLVETHVIFLILESKRCFPANTKIKLGNGQIVMMSDLQKGDKVQTGY